MRYFKYIILCIIFFPLSVSALEGVIINCPDHIDKNEEFDCQVVGNAPYKVSAIEYEFKLPDYIEKIRFKVDSSWEGDEEDNLVLLYTDENKVSPFNLGVITLKSSKTIDQVDITTEYLLFGDENYNEHLLIEKKDVKEMKSEEKKVNNKKNNKFIYVIIIVIIIVGLLTAYTLKRKRVII